MSKKVGKIWWEAANGEGEKIVVSKNYKKEGLEINIHSFLHRYSTNPSTNCKQQARISVHWNKILNKMNSRLQGNSCLLIQYNKMGYTS